MEEMSYENIVNALEDKDVDVVFECRNGKVRIKMGKPAAERQADFGLVII